MNTSDKKPESKAKLIAAGITLLLGIILAIGYPTGGVIVNGAQQNKIISRTIVKNQNNNTTNAEVVNQKKNHTNKD